eukprot:6497957-Prymnesium_polylepis.1
MLREATEPEGGGAVRKLWAPEARARPVQGGRRSRTRTRRTSCAHSSARASGGGRRGARAEPETPPLRAAEAQVGRGRMTVRLGQGWAVRDKREAQAKKRLSLSR